MNQPLFRKIYIFLISLLIAITTIHVQSFQISGGMVNMLKRTARTDNPYREARIHGPPSSAYTNLDGHIVSNARRSECTHLNMHQSTSSTANAENGNSLGKRRRAARKITSLFKSLPLSLSSRGSDARTGTTDSTKISLLEQENDILRRTVAELERENEFLGKGSKSRIIMEQFEGEGKPMIDVNGEEIESTWWENENGDVESQAFKLGLTNRAASMEPLLNSNGTSTYAASNTMAISTLEECDEYNDGVCPIEPDLSFKAAFKDRAYWLVGLLALQSMSGFILARNEELLQTHPVIIYFLTMLVGAGGNAGNQAAVRVIRGIALGTLNERTQRQFLNREFKMACSLSATLSVAGFIRATLFNTPIAETIAITTALAIIVFISICAGALLPLLLRRINVDPAHSSTTIQVIMDILGVVLTVAVSTTILDSAGGQLIIAKLTGNS